MPSSFKNWTAFFILSARRQASPLFFSTYRNMIGEIGT